MTSRVNGSPEYGLGNVTLMPDVDWHHIIEQPEAYKGLTGEALHNLFPEVIPLQRRQPAIAEHVSQAAVGAQILHFRDTPAAPRQALTYRQAIWCQEQDEDYAAILRQNQRADVIKNLQLLMGGMGIRLKMMFGAR